ncbi:MAG TPA: thioesterase [Candidatus Cloacimonas sp.]|jgi:uncharacterized protein (TIGR00369 family)|nr:hypothetical protein [Candidatus Cloacimonadota bacterium]HCX72958.1 thioesterase [Candidatus Cloacimonas sp.]
MKKLKNPYLEMPGFNCFGCAQDNNCGLQMQFYEDGENIISYWNPREHWQGYFDILHGGVQATLLDEVASWVVFVKLKTAGVTSKLEIKYKRPISTKEGSLRIEANLVQMKRNIAIIEARIFTAEEQLGTMATVQYFTFSQQKAADQFKYPGLEKFYE